MSGLYMLGAVIFGISSAAKLPDFIHTCKLSDPNYHACILENGAKTLPGILKGDPSIKLPKFTPYEIKNVILDTNNLKMEFDNLKVYDIEMAQLKDAKFDFKNKVLFCQVIFPKITIKSHYKMDGQILIMKLTGNGNAVIIYDNAVCNFTMTYDIYENNSKNYMRIVESNLKYSTDKVTFNFENLIPGAEEIGNEMNSFMNENWQIINEEISEGTAEIFKSVVLVILNAFAKVPMDELFPK